MNEPTPPPAHPPAQTRVGIVGELAHILKTLSLTNVLILGLVIAILAPTYILWTALHDETVLGKFFSRFEEVAGDKSPCTLRIFSLRGAPPSFAITTGFAFQGADRYIVGVILDEPRPDDSVIDSYCATLNMIVDYMRRPDAKSPVFPGTDEPLIWHYPPEGSP